MDGWVGGCRAVVPSHRQFAVDARMHVTISTEINDASISRQSSHFIEGPYRAFVCPRLLLLIVHPCHPCASYTFPVPLAKEQIPATANLWLN